MPAREQPSKQTLAATAESCDHRRTEPSGGEGTLLATVFQDLSIYQGKAVEDDVRSGLDGPRSLPRPERAERVAFHVDELGLPGLATASPATRPGGVRPRVSID